MKVSATDSGDRLKRTEFRRKLFLLTIVGGIVFWLATFVTSLLPIAAAYRAAYSNWSIQTVWVGSVFAGMLFSCCVSYFYLRFYDKIPTMSPVLKSLLVSTVALVIAILIIDVPMVLQSEQFVLHYFFIGVLFNSVRFLLLGFAIGFVYKRLNDTVDSNPSAS